MPDHSTPGAAAEGTREAHAPPTAGDRPELRLATPEADEASGLGKQAIVPVMELRDVSVF